MNPTFQTQVINLLQIPEAVSEGKKSLDNISGCSKISLISAHPLRVNQQQSS
jgi:hypothetical protein